MSFRVHAVMATGMVLTLALVVTLGAALLVRHQARLEERRQHARTLDRVSRLAAMSAAIVALYREFGREKGHGPDPLEPGLSPCLVRAWTFERSVPVEGEHDVWGERMRLKTNVARGISIPATVTSRHERLLVYSCGPDRRDDGGDGDDVACDHETRD
ncbi:MAG: hypothetical protein ACAI25_10410 [Planctomycetota bacterium]